MITIANYHLCRLSPLEPDLTTKSDCCEEREQSVPTILNITKHTATSEYRCAYTMAYEEGFWDYNGEGCYFVAGILRILGATGRTAWALSGHQRIPHLFEKGIKMSN